MCVCMCVSCHRGYPGYLTSIALSPLLPIEIKQVMSSHGVMWYHWFQSQNILLWVTGYMVFGVRQLPTSTITNFQVVLSFFAVLRGGGGVCCNKMIDELAQ